MSTKRINIKDITKEEFYQLPKAFFWKKEYREGLSNDAKLLYMIMRDRFNLSIYKTKEQIDAGIDSPSYIDEKGDIYCILDNQEIEFTLDTSHRSVLKYIKELIDFKLIEKEPTKGGANRIYLKELDTTSVSLQRFLGEKIYYKHVQARKRKKLEPVKTLEECIAEAESKELEKQNKSSKNPQNVDKPVDEGVDNKMDNLSPKEEEGEGSAKSNHLDDAKSNHLGGQKVTTEVVQKVTPNNTYSSDLDSNSTYPKENDTKNNYISSSSIEENPSVVDSDDKSVLEEETQLKHDTMISITNDYALLRQVPAVGGMSIHDICISKKDWNVLNSILKKSKIDAFPGVVVGKALVEYSKNLANSLRYGPPIDYPPAYFANGLADEARRYMNNRQKVIA